MVAGEKGLGKSILTNARLVAESTRGRLAGELEGQPLDHSLPDVDLTRRVRGAARSPS
jgi:hypothetical protein